MVDGQFVDAESCAIGRRCFTPPPCPRHQLAVMHPRPPQQSLKFRWIAHVVAVQQGQRFAAPGHRGGHEVAYAGAQAGQRQGQAGHQASGVVSRAKSMGTWFAWGWALDAGTLYP